MKKAEWEALRLPDKKMEYLLFNHPDKFPITLEEFEECENYWKHVVIPHCEKMLSHDYVRKVLRVFFQKKLGFISQKKDELYNLNDKLRDSGLSYEERTERVFSKLSVLNEMEEETNKHLIGFEILSLIQWLIPADIGSIKRGLNNFIIQNYPRFICQKS